MEPNSALLVIVLFAAAIGSLIVLVRYANIFLRIGTGVIALVLATVGGMAVVNDYYGYYQTWSQLSADLTGSYAQFTSAALGNRVDPKLAGKVISVPLPGAASGINRGGYVYLPPQYFQHAYAHTHFPVVELLHGTPSYNASWLVHMHVDALANQLISHHLMGPMVIVMPQTYSGHTYEECLNSSRGQDDTYLTDDVRQDIECTLPGEHDSVRVGGVGHLLRRVLRGEPGVASPVHVGCVGHHQRLLPSRGRTRRAGAGTTTVAGRTRTTRCYWLAGSPHSRNRCRPSGCQPA